MLILTRKLGESITIGDSVKVTVLGIHGKQVKLGVVAPESILVHREEIYLKIKNEKSTRTGKPSKSNPDKIAFGSLDETEKIQSISQEKEPGKE